MNKKMKVKKIIINYLKKNGYEGLYDSNNCGCDIKDLADCEENFSGCSPGYKKDCKKCDNKDEKGNCNEGIEYCIGGKK